MSVPEAVPSTKNQLVLAHALCEELKELGIGDAVVDEFGRVYGHLSATPGHENDKTYGLIAHMDTSPDASGENVKPRQIAYAGGDIVLNEAEHIVMRAAGLPHSGALHRAKASSLPTEPLCWARTTRPVWRRS